MNQDYQTNNDLAEFETEGGELDTEGAWSEGGDGFSTNDFAEKPKRSVNTGTLIIILVIVLAAVGLWSMRSLAIAMAGDSTNKGLEDTIDSWIETLTNTDLSTNTDAHYTVEFDDVASDALVEDRTTKQVPLQNVQKNPFIPWLDAKPPVDTNNRPIEVVDDNAIRREQLIDTFELAAAKLRVVMILGGSDAIANVSGKIVYEGDTLNDDKLGVEFKVVSIEEGIVVIAGEDKQIDLYYEIALRLHQNR